MLDARRPDSCPSRGRACGDPEPSSPESDLHADLELVLLKAWCCDLKAWCCDGAFGSLYLEALVGSIEVCAYATSAQSVHAFLMSACPCCVHTDRMCLQLRVVDIVRLHVDVRLTTIQYMWNHSINHSNTTQQATDVKIFMLYRMRIVY